MKQSEEEAFTKASSSVVYRLSGPGPGTVRRFTHAGKGSKKSFRIVFGCRFVRMCIRYWACESRYPGAEREHGVFAKNRMEPYKPCEKVRNGPLSSVLLFVKILKIDAPLVLSRDGMGGMDIVIDEEVVDRVALSVS